jgi:hypothetical protein
LYFYLKWEHFSEYPNTSKLHTCQCSGFVPEPQEFWPLYWATGTAVRFSGISEFPRKLFKLNIYFLLLKDCKSRCCKFRWINNTDMARTSLIFWQCRRSLVLCAFFVDRCLSFCTFSFGHCVVCSSSTYRFWLPLWYLQTLIILRTKIITLARQINRERNNNFFRNKNDAGQANTPVLKQSLFLLRTIQNWFIVCP